MDLKQVAELRARTSCGIKDCKKALQECDGDIDKAIEYLRKKGLATAGKVSGRATNAGRVFSYIHQGGQVGVLLEISCETDFVANTEEFQQLGQNLCLQICAMMPAAVSREQVTEEAIEKEKSIYREQLKEQLEGKPEKVQENILSGKIEKFFAESMLLDQQYIKSENKQKVSDIIKESIATLKENISVKRFARFQIGG